MENETTGSKAMKSMTQAFVWLKNITPSRETSLSITKLEEAMMWCNKARTIKGEFKPNPTHV